MNIKYLLIIILCVPIITKISSLSGFLTLYKSGSTLESAVENGDINKVKEFLQNKVEKEKLNAAVDLCNKQITKTNEQENKMEWQSSKPAGKGIALMIVNPEWENINKISTNYRNILNLLQEALKK